MTSSTKEHQQEAKRGFVQTCRMVGRRLAKQEKLTAGEMVIFLFCALVWWSHLQIRKFKVWVKTTNWNKVADDASLVVTGITIPFWVWFIWSYINVIANNISSPELISKYNMFVVFLEIFS